MFIERTDVEDETPILWPRDAKGYDDYLLEPCKWFVFFFVFVIVFLYKYIICVFFGHSELTRGSLRTVVQPHDLLLLAQTHFLVINI